MIVNTARFTGSPRKCFLFVTKIGESAGEMESHVASSGFEKQPRTYAPRYLTLLGVSARPGRSFS
jgi:hypothetical protein